MRRLRVLRKADTLDDLDLRLEAFDPPPLGFDEVLIAVHAAGVNRSDISATLGRMPHAIWPRTPGRDWAGVVIEGPQALIGQEVFGTGGDLGISRDGTHATHLVLHRDALVVRPQSLTPAGRALVADRKKVLVLDLDNTLWQGTLLEDSEVTLADEVLQQESPHPRAEQGFIRHGCPPSSA